MQKVPVSAKSADLTSSEAWQEGGSFFFQEDKSSVPASNSSCASVGRSGGACFSCEQQQGGRPTEVKAAPQGLAESHCCLLGSHAGSRQISEVTGGECWGLWGNNASQGQPAVGNHVSDSP